MFTVCNHIFETLADAIAYANFLAETCNEIVAVEEVQK
jgi:hypothetical protein